MFAPCPAHCSIHRSFQGDWRLNSAWANYSPVMGQVVQNQVLFMNPPSFTYKAEVTYNTSAASSTHFLRYIDQICSGLDFEFAFKVRCGCAIVLCGRGRTGTSIDRRVVNVCVRACVRSTDARETVRLCMYYVHTHMYTHFVCPPVPVCMHARRWTTTSATSTRPGA